MKKGLAIFLSIIYLAVVSGITFQLHYCGGKLASVKIGLVDANHTCSCGSKKMKRGCCKDQTICVKVQGDQKSSTNSVIPSNNANNIAILFPSFVLNYTSLQHIPFPSNYHSPPPRYSKSLLILNNTFRI